MKVSDLKKEEVIHALQQSKTKLDFLHIFGYKNNGSGYRFVENVIKYFKINIYDYLDKKITEEEYNKHPSYCKYCGKKLNYSKRNNKFCSKSCSASYNNSTRVHSITSRLKTSKALSGENATKEIKECKLCGRTFIGDKDFCSGKCRKTFENNDKLDRWLNGENFLRGATQVPTFVRKYLMNKYNCQCQRCGWGEENPYTHTVQLEIHHIDGDCTNNKKENLQLLCPNCHSLTENFGSLNKMSHRFHRKRVTLQN